MKNNTTINRRTALKSSALGLLTVSLPSIISGRETRYPFQANPNIPKKYPYIDDEIASSVVGKSHSNLEKVKEMVDKRPELARATWEWRFGDWESAIGAASHVGRRDIASYLISKGARPTIFTYAMFGAYDVVKSMIEFHPGIQQTFGPHGISLLRHAQAGRRMEDKMSLQERDNLKRLIGYLESLGDANGEKYLDVKPEDQKKYLGDYKYGDGPKDGFTIQLNMRDLLSLGGIGEFGGAIYKIDENKFIYNGAPSVVITFQIEGEMVKSLTVSEPDFSITAKKVK